jgi:flavin reductase (DIM6/NTAB) family NADH-FMN oxidoreductase RutF
MMSTLINLNQQQCSRVLYSNPVCLLCTVDASGKRNVMTVSWLTASDNLGHCLLVLNRGRHTAAHMGTAGNLFVLSVATAEQCATVLRIGSCSGRDLDVDKVAHLGLPVHVIDADSGLFGIEGCAAHLVCRVNTQLSPAAPIGDEACARAFQSTTNHHLLLHCTAMRGLVSERHWDGRRFAATGDAAPHLSFLGSQQFAATIPIHSESSPFLDRSGT